jgi:hypothetical protein
MKPAKARYPEFVREAVHQGEHIFVRTTCEVCGESFTGNVNDGLVEWEQQHSCCANAPELRKPAA